MVIIQVFKINFLLNEIVIFMYHPNLDVVQDIAAKGLYLTYTSCPDKDRAGLVSALTTELLHGRLEVRQSTDSDSKKSGEKSEAGKSSTG